MERDIQQTTTSNMATSVENASVSSYSPDTVGDQKETTWINSNWNEQVGYFKGKDVIPQFHRAVQALSTWTAGKGYTTEEPYKTVLDNITGWGNETFDEIMINMINMKKVTGDAFAEIIRDDDGYLINLKILGGDTIRIHVNSKGIITHYEQIARTGTKTPARRLETNQVFHITNDRVADEIHGTSLAEIVKWVVTAKKEAMEDWKRISHRSTIRVMYIDSQDTTKLTHIKTEYATAISSGELMIIPAKRGEAEFEDLTLPPVEAFMRWIEYLDNLFYQVVGVPKVIATSEGFTESGGKTGFFTFEPIYTKEQTLLEGDIWNQLAIKVKFNRPPSLGGALQKDEMKDAGGKIGFQPNDAQVGEGA